MQIVTSWMQQGIEQGTQNEARLLVLRQLRKRLASLDPDSEARISKLPVERMEELAEALLDFPAPSDLTNWLKSPSN